MDQGWQEYVRAIDSKVIRVEEKIDKLLSINSKMAGVALAVSAFVALVFEIGKLIVSIKWSQP